MSVSLPWQQQQWQRLLDLQGANKLPHALLLSGPIGTGKRKFATAFAQWLLCSAPKSNLPCGDCRQCDFNKAQTHPDLKLVEPEEKGKSIKVDQVRELVSFLNQTAQQGGYRITIIAPAEKMNINSANALLKSLEEPGDKTVLLLLTDSPGQLLPTIRSRCQRVDFPLPQTDQALAWLTPLVPNNEDAEQLLFESSGQPITALDVLASDLLAHRQQWTKDFFALIGGKVSPLSLAEKWLDYELSDILVWLDTRLSGVIRAHLANVEVDARWQQLVMDDAKPAYLLRDDVLTLKAQLGKGLNPNKQLALEQILFKTCEVFTV